MAMFDKKGWSKAIEEVFRLSGYNGHVTIEDDLDAPGDYFINHSDFGCPFIGFYPKTDEFFTVLTTEHHFTDLNNFDRIHREAFVFNAFSKEPVYYSIYKEPEYQRVLITDFMRFKKGDIVYANNCRHGGYRQYTLVKPIFESEVINIGSLITTLKYGQ